MVSVMSEGPFFRQDRKATEFRVWLGEGENLGVPQQRAPGVLLAAAIRDGFDQAQLL